MLKLNEKIILDNQQVNEIIWELSSSFLEVTTEQFFGTDEEAIKEIFIILRGLSLLGQADDEVATWNSWKSIKMRFGKAVWDHLSDKRKKEGDFYENSVVMDILESENSSSPVEFAILRALWSSGNHENLTLQDLGLKERDCYLTGAFKLADQSEHPVLAVFVSAAIGAIIYFFPPTVYIFGSLGMMLGSMQIGKSVLDKERAIQTGEKFYEMAQADIGFGQGTMVVATSVAGVVGGCAKATPLPRGHPKGWSRSALVVGGSNAAATDAASIAGGGYRALTNKQFVLELNGRRITAAFVKDSSSSSEPTFRMVFRVRDKEDADEVFGLILELYNKNKPAEMRLSTEPGRMDTGFIEGHFSSSSIQMDRGIALEGGMQLKIYFHAGRTESTNALELLSALMEHAGLVVE